MTSQKKQSKTYLSDTYRRFHDAPTLSVGDVQAVLDHVVVRRHGVRVETKSGLAGLVQVAIGQALSQYHAAGDGVPAPGMSHAS